MSARVHLALPERRLFDRDMSEPKASVWLELRYGDLAGRQARAVRNLVAGAVPGLKPTSVTILDDEGRLLASGDADGDGAAMEMEDRKAAIEERLRRRIVDMVESVVGPGSVRAQVSVTADFNRVTESQEIFDPEGQVVRSTQVTDEQLSESEAEAQPGVTVAENVPQADDGGEDPERTSQSATSRTREIINYEISKRTRTEVHEVGAITRLSVAVAVDGVTTVGEDGAETYEPRADEEMERIAALVRNAVGYEEERGDSLEVANVRFARQLPDPNATGAPPAMSFDKNDMMRGAELIVLLIVAIMIIFLVARPLVKSALPAPAGAAGALGGAGGVGALPDGSAGGEGAIELELAGVEGGDSADGLEGGMAVAAIDGELRDSTMKKMSDIVENHPDESIQILRTWLHEG